MRGSWEIGRLSGISVRVHWSFLILPALIGWSAWSAAGAVAAIDAVVFVLAVFGCVVLHEMGHALAARRYGIGTRHITLLPIGGLAQLERMPRQPVQELVIALAGPAVNVVIAAAILLGFWVRLGSLAPILDGGLLGGSLLIRLFWANVVLVVFNLLPAFPMDGGRVLRSLLAMRMPHVRATNIASRVGQSIAVVLGILGLFGSPMLIFVALFVFIAARSEAAMARMQESAGGVHVGDLMQRHFRTVRADSRLAELAPWLPLTPQRDFPVIHRGQLVGMLRSSDLVSAMAAGQGDRLAGEIMQRDVPTILREDGVMETFVKMQKIRLGSLPVADAGILVGILSRDRVHGWLESLTSNPKPCASQT